MSPRTGGVREHHARSATVLAGCRPIDKRRVEAAHERPSPRLPFTGARVGQPSRRRRAVTRRRHTGLTLPSPREDSAMLYPELFHSMERARWSLGDVPWDRLDRAALTDEQALTIRMNAITEWSALPATEMFLRDNRHDSDFSAFMSIWFYEEQKHALALIEYLRRARPALVPSDEELHAVRFEFDPAPPYETLMLHFCGELRLT